MSDSDERRCAVCTAKLGLKDGDRCHYCMKLTTLNAEVANRELTEDELIDVGQSIGQINWNRGDLNRVVDTFCNVR